MRDLHYHGRDGEKVIDGNILFNLSWLGFNPKVGGLPKIKTEIYNIPIPTSGHEG